MATSSSSHSNPATRRLLILTEGATRPLSAKTAASVIRYRTPEVVALLDSTQTGKTCQQLLGVGGAIPVVASVHDAPQANTLLIGTAPPGGRLPPSWRAILLEGIERGMDIVSGLHEFLTDDPQLVEAAGRQGTQLIDVRKNDERDVADGLGFRAGCLRILTVGQDCGVGKMVVAIELTRALQAQGHSTKFVATGQTGIMIEGDGCPIDRVISDFTTGAIEKLVRANEQHDFLMIEGQGSIAHPRYSPVTLGLLHGSRPQGMILCYELNRPHVHGMPHVPLLSPQRLREAYESAAGWIEPSRVIGIAINTRAVDDAEADAQCRQVSEVMGLPACDVLRHGTQPLTDAVLALHTESLK